MPVAEAVLERVTAGDMVDDEDDVLLAVMGVTGAGKSSFIKAITGSEDIVIGHGLKSETSQIASYKFSSEGISYVLVDTPGFDDTNLNNTGLTDREILQSVVSWLSAKFKAGLLLSGVIYLHPITSPRVQGSTMTQIRVLKELCGANFFDKVTLGTTFWEKVEGDEGQARETELFSTASFLGDMKDLGAKTARVYQDRISCVKLVEAYATGKKKPMKIQLELEDQGATFESSSALAALSPDLMKVHLEKQEEEDRMREAAAKREQANADRVRRAEAQRQADLRQRERDAQREAARARREHEAAEKRRKAEIERQRDLERQRLLEARTARERREREQKLAREKEEKLKEERAAAEKAAREREAARERQRQAQEQAERARRLIAHSRLPMQRRGDGLFDSAKRCQQLGHAAAYYPQASMKCNRSNCHVIACFYCWNSGKQILHVRGCYYQSLPY